MNSVRKAAAPQRTWSVELALVVALPLAAVIASSTTAYIAYVKGFTALPEKPPVTALHKHR
jgi:hypothetical protein